LSNGEAISNCGEQMIGIIAASAFIFDFRIAVADDLINSGFIQNTKKKVDFFKFLTIPL
jgi:hypothetical protein